MCISAVREQAHTPAHFTITIVRAMGAAKPIPARTTNVIGDMKTVILAHLGTAGETSLQVIEALESLGLITASPMT